MSFLTALGLSTNNLLTKKARTILTAFAGSIGIIGIALIMSLSTGIQNYIDKVQEDMLLSYPMSVEKQTMDISSIMTSMTGLGMEAMQGIDVEEDTVYVNEAFMQMVNAFISQASSNNLKNFKNYIEDC